MIAGLPLTVTPDYHCFSDWGWVFVWQPWLWQAIWHGIKVRGKWMRQTWGKVGYGWMTWEMLEARVAGANFQMFDVSFLWYLILFFFVLKVDIHLLLKEHSPKKDSLNSLSREQVEVQVKKNTDLARRPSHTLENWRNRWAIIYRYMRVSAYDFWMCLYRPQVV